MLQRPSIDATPTEIEQFVRSWVKVAGTDGFELALSLIDANPEVPWSNELFDQLTYNHFDDEEHCRITDPD